MAKANQFFYNFMLATSIPLLSCPFHYIINVEGRENLPKGRIILAANHSSFMDSIFLTGGVRKRIYYLSKHFSQDTTYSHITFQTLLMRGMGHVLLEKEVFEKRHLKQLLYLLKEGEYVCMFPEGTRSYDGKIQDFKEGLAELSYLSQTPVAPVAIIGSREVWPKGVLLPKPYGRIEIIIGKPIPHPKSKDEVKRLLGIVKEEMEKLYYG